MLGKLFSPSFLEQLLQHSVDSTVILKYCEDGRVFRTSTIAGISLLLTLLSCPQPGDVPMPPWSSHAGIGQCTVVCSTTYLRCSWLPLRTLIDSRDREGPFQRIGFSKPHLRIFRCRLSSNKRSGHRVPLKQAQDESHVYLSKGNGSPFA